MSSSNSENDSDSDGFSILDIISNKRVRNSGKLNTNASVETAKLIPENPPGSNLLSKVPEDEFDISLPTIFLTDAKKNEQLAKQNTKIRADLVKDEISMQQEYNQLQARKQAIINELNDNGTVGPVFSLNDDRDKQFIDKLLQTDLKGSKTDILTQRHFYLYSNPPTEINLDTQLPFSINISSLCFELQPDNYEKFYLNISSFFSLFINHVLMNIQDLNCLILLNNFTQAIYKSSFVSSEIITEEKFLNYISVIGGDVKYITRKPNLEIPLKLINYNTQYRITIVKLSIIYHYFFFVTKNDYTSTLDDLYEVMLKTFLLSLSDFNLNEGKVDELITSFVTPVFTNLLDWRRDKLMKCLLASETTQDDEKMYAAHDRIVCEINETIKSQLNTCLYEDRDNISVLKSKFRKIDYELHYNVLRLLNLSILQSMTGPFSMRLVTSLCLTFMGDTDYTLCELYRQDPTREELNFTICNFTPSFKYVMSVLNKMNALDLEKRIDSNDIEQINTLYKNYYKLLLLNPVIFKTFHSNLNTSENIQNFKQIKQSNCSKLTQISNILNKLKDNIHRGLGQLSHVSLVHPSSPYKDDIIHIITEHYHLLHYLKKKCDKDIMLIGEDAFYEDKTLR